MRNGPPTTETLALPLNPDVKVYRENEGWTGPHKLISTNRETCVINMPHGPTEFRSVVVKPHYTNDDSSEPSKISNNEFQIKQSKQCALDNTEVKNTQRVEPKSADIF